MERIEYIRFKNPREVGWLMADLFDMYWAYPFDSFIFSWLERTPDLEVLCKDATDEKIRFSTPPALLEAIHSCQKISSPTRWLPSSDFGFVGFIQSAIHEVEKNVSNYKARTVKMN
ncbi:hypothetical protein D8B26_000553 [Coccidioides posadasii str. Silveira]|uniref:uncharacterized protein n=1 Tax=Coccidioides posadasii (strain RMSCC 757 / Silveira) TaxID=443226 RepID=UPI001BEE72FD|nr:hypothetical protein D8B26_000553 [Coccidioides posadasii str. Silveira]